MLKPKILPLDKIASIASSFPRPFNLIFSTLLSCTESLLFMLNKMVVPTPESSIKFNSFPFTSIGKTTKLLINLKEIVCFLALLISLKLLCA